MLSQRGKPRRGILAAALLVGGLTSGCDRESRSTRVSPPHAQVLETLTVSELRPGGMTHSPQASPVVNAYEKNAYSLAEGKRLYSFFNCSGCHSNGGGGMGPPLIDDEWIYGNRAEQVFASIVQGRPNGMPAYQQRLTNQQAWLIAAYVRSLGGLTEALTAPGRGDHLQGRLPENSLPRQSE